MHDCVELVKGLRDCSRRNARVCMICGAKASNLCDGTKSKRMFYAADAIEELLAVCRDVAAFVICYADDDEVSAEVLCRKLHKIGVVEKDGAWWTLPEPSKEVE